MRKHAAACIPACATNCTAARTAICDVHVCAMDPISHAAPSAAVLPVGPLSAAIRTGAVVMRLFHWRAVNQHK